MIIKRETFTDEFQFSDDSDVIESFEIALLVLLASGVASVSRTSGRATGGSPAVH